MAQQAGDRESGRTTAIAAKPEEQELERKRAEQAAIETELADRELRSANLRAELGAFERQYLHRVGLRYAELDELKARISERLAEVHPGNQRAQKTARESRARADETKFTAGEPMGDEPGAFESSPEMRLWLDPARAVPEIARVLKPGGRLGVIWTSRDRGEDWVAELDLVRAPGAYGAGTDSGEPRTARPH